MINKLQKTIQRSLEKTLINANKEYRLSRHSPLVYDAISSFIKNGGKRLRPLLLVISYYGYAKQPSRTIYHGAAGFELLHACSLIHDDIIDDAALRRNQPSMHEYMSQKLDPVTTGHCSGKNLALIAGDIIYTLGIQEFVKIKAPHDSRAAALQLLLSAAMFTGLGECKELFATTKPIDSFTKERIYSLYDLKTGMYTFCYPLRIGATLAGSTRNECEKLMRLGTILGRAFQLNDDINDYLCSSTTFAKDSFADIPSGKRTLPLLYIYQAASKKERHFIETCMKKGRLTSRDKRIFTAHIQQPTVWRRLRKEIDSAVMQAHDCIQSLCIKKEYKDALRSIVRRLFS